MRAITIPEDNQIIRDSDHASVASSLAYLSFPLVVRGFFMSVVQFFLKRSILAQKDEALLAAYSGFSAIEGFIFILIFSSLHIISAKAGKLHASKKDPKKMGDLYQEGLAFGHLLMLPTLALCVSAKPIFKYMEQPSVVIESSNRFFAVGMIAYYFDMLYRVQARLAMGASDSTVALIGDAVESAVDVAVTYVLVNGKLGFPEMGVCSASWGYAIGAIAAWVGSTLYLKYAPHFQQYDLFSFVNPIDMTELKDTVMSGLYLAFGDIIMDVTQILVTFSCGLSGPGALVASQAASTYSYCVALPGDGVMEASTVLTAQFYEKKDAERFRAVSRATYLATMGLSLVSGAFLLLNMDRVTGIFVSNDAKHRADFEMVNAFLRIQACMELVNSVRQPSVAMLTGCQDTRYPFLLNAAFIFVLNSLLVSVASFVYNAGPVVAFGVQLAGMVLCAIGVGSRWQGYVNQARFWESPRHPDVQEQPPAIANVVETVQPSPPAVVNVVETVQPSPP